ncbi:unnamed protein product [Nezara viridula]|uniref:Uncharacterized protein n=1 Tax=Nezara viridula TaxID=85310 RepID=A0A9P0HRY4_NEZVI|nr:unnamed protein product [Nezara viridula]
MSGQQSFLLFPCWLPFNLDNIFLHIAVIFWQTMLIANEHYMSFGGMGVLYIPYEHIKAEIKILKFALENVQGRSYEMARERGAFRKDKSEKVDQKILFDSYISCTRSCAQHHVQIMKYVFH